jgi:hypothetical protein
MTYYDILKRQELDNTMAKILPGTKKEALVD